MEKNVEFIRGKSVIKSNMESFIKYFDKKPELRNPILLEGLPGFGQVGRLVAEHLVKEFKAKKFAELYSPHFPPQVLIKSNGLIDMLTNNFYGIKLKDADRDLLVVVGEAQGATVEGQYEICEKIIEVAKEFGVKDIITVGGYATGKLLKEPKVYGAASTKKAMKPFKGLDVSFTPKGGARGGIVGASGILLGLGKLEGMNSVCLMGETPGHPLLIDAKAGEAIINVLGKHLDIKIPLGDLEKRAKELEKFRLGLEKMMKKVMKKKKKQKKEEEEADEDELRYIG